MQTAQVGFAVVSGDRGTARALSDEARRFIDAELLGRAEVIDVAVEEGELEA